MRKLLLLGGTGLVGSRVFELLKDKFEINAPTSNELDVANFNHVKDGIENFQPDLILYTAGFTNVDLAEEKQDECYSLNVKGVENFVNEIKNVNIPFYYLSTDYVFDGTQKDRPYNENDKPNPTSGVYAKSKRDGELVTLSGGKNCVIRLIMPFSAVYVRKMDIARFAIDKLKKGERLSGISNQKINPIFVDDLVLSIFKILEKNSNGIYHLGAIDFTTPYDFILEIARQFDLDKNLVDKITFEEFSEIRAAKRPQHSWLDTSKFRTEFGEEILQSVSDEIKLFKEQIDSKGIFS